MTAPHFSALIDFLQKECDLPSDTIAIAFRRPVFSANQLPIALWQLGLISLEDVSRVFDWMETQIDRSAMVG